MEVPQDILDAIHHERIKWDKEVTELLNTKEPYVEIFKLLSSYQYETDEEGLEQKHFRYALVNRKNETLEYTKSMETFFGDSLDAGIITRDCIPSRKHLNFYLKRLCQLGIIDRLGRKKPYRYRISDKYNAYSIRYAVKFCVDIWDDDLCLDCETALKLLGSQHKDFYYYWKLYGICDKLYNVKDRNKPFINEAAFPLMDSAFRNSDPLWYLFGLDKKFFDALDSKERALMREHLKNINKAVKGILDIKFKITKPEMAMDEYSKRRNTINPIKDKYSPGEKWRKEDMKCNIDIFIHADRVIT